MIIHVKERSLTCNDARYLASLLISCKFFYFYSLSWNLKVHLEYILYSFYHCWRTAYIEYAFLYITRIKMPYQHGYVYPSLFALPLIVSVFTLFFGNCINDFKILICICTFVKVIFEQYILPTSV